MTDRTTVLGKDRQLRMHLIMVFNVDYLPPSLEPVMSLRLRKCRTASLVAFLFGWISSVVLELV